MSATTAHPAFGEIADAVEESNSHASRARSERMTEPPRGDAPELEFGGFGESPSNEARIATALAAGAGAAVLAAYERAALLIEAGEVPTAKMLDDIATLEARANVTATLRERFDPPETVR